MDQASIIIIIIQILIIKEIGIEILNKEEEYIPLIKVYMKDIGIIIKNMEKEYLN